jgi:arylsulfatase A-like enzyme
MKSRSLLTRVHVKVIATAIILAAVAAWNYQKPRPPNILLVIADDMGLDASPCYGIGSEKPDMPALESLCEGGLVFENVWSNPLCSPTRATILTGRYSLRTGIGTTVRGSGGIALTETSLQRLLDERAPTGYSHAVFGKWHLADRTNGGPENPNRMGVGHFSGIFRGQGDYWNWRRTENGQTRVVAGYSTTVFTDDAIAWIQQQRGPWFLWLAYTAPHAPFHLPPADLHHRSELSGDSADIAARLLPYYLAMLEALDHEMGRLLSSLPPDVRENTTVIFIGDNGTPGRVAQPPYRRRRAKGTLYEGGIHVPMVVAGAGVTRQGEREAALVNTTDLFATIAAMGGAEVDRVGDSESFARLLTDRGAPKRSFAYAEHFNSQPFARDHDWAIRDDRYKLVLFGRGERRLFDLIEDPFERRDLLAGEPSAEALSAVEKLQRLADRVHGR